MEQAGQCSCTVHTPHVLYDHAYCWGEYSTSYRLTWSMPCGHWYECWLAGRCYLLLLAEDVSLMTSFTWGHWFNPAFTQLIGFRSLGLVLTSRFIYWRNPKNLSLCTIAPSSHPLPSFCFVVTNVKPRPCSIGHIMLIKLTELGLHYECCVLCCISGRAQWLVVPSNMGRISQVSWYDEKLYRDVCW